MENPSGAHRPEDRVLLVDDSRTLRHVIGAKLRKLGFAVEEAASGEEALARFKAGDIQLVVSDWMMPGMDGLELIRAIRAGEAEECFTYIILMTAKQDKAALGEGFAAGADDFIAKPVDTTELTARLSAGRRLVGLHNTLAAQKAQTDDAYAALKTVYGQLEADLAVASMLQRAYLPPAAQTVNGCRIASLCRFKGHVGGDHVGCFPIGEHALGAFSIDVSGHGVASCLLAIRLAELFAPRHQGDSIAFGRDGSGQAVARAPQDVLAELNSHGLLGEGHDLYFTMAYAVIDGPSGDVALCTAGHWPAIVQSRDGQIRFCEMATAPP
ncbi:MAG: response regulator, partial [Pseudomonadota bacterium]